MRKPHVATSALSTATSFLRSSKRRNVCDPPVVQPATEAIPYVLRLTKEDPLVTRRIAPDADYLNYDYAKFGGYLDKTVVGIPLLPA